MKNKQYGYAPNSSHFTGVNGKFKKARKKRSSKAPRVHKNKYERIKKN